MNDADAVTACFFGEGAVAEGEFHESMNLAALWRLPVLFVCENNGYAMGSALELTESETDLTAKAACYGIAATSVDGMDVVAVEAAARKALAQIAETDAPQFLECKTYRFRAHSMQFRGSRAPAWAVQVHASAAPTGGSTGVGIADEAAPQAAVLGE